MDFGLTDAQKLLRDSIAELLARQVPIERVRSIMEADGYDRALDATLAEQGLFSSLIRLDDGGDGLGLLDAAVIAQELGRMATPVNYHSAAVGVPLVLTAVASTTEREEWFAGLLDGSARTAVVDCNATTASRSDGSITVRAVADAASADRFLVIEGHHVYGLSSGHGALGVTALETVDDTRRIAEVRVDLSKLSSEQPFSGELATEQYDRAVQAQQIVLAADALGASQKALELAVDYAKQREQFGRVVASFQAVKHMCAEIATALEPLQSLVWHAAYLWDQDDSDAAWQAPLLKAHAAEMCTEAVTKATQVWGGIGFTWECDNHLFFKRVGFDRQICGSPTTLRQRAAQLQLAHV